MQTFTILTRPFRRFRRFVTCSLSPSIVVLNHGANGGILDFPAVQVHADLVTTFELALWFLGGHVKECASSSSSTRTRTGKCIKTPTKNW